MLSRQNTLRLPPSLNQDLANPPRNLINPTTSNKHTRNSVDDPDNQSQETTPLLADKQHDRLDVVFEEDSRDKHRRLGDRATLAGCCVLIREDSVPSRPGVRSVYVECIFALGIEGRHDGEEVLEFVVVGAALGDGFVQRVEQTWVVRAEGQFSNHMREIECCGGLVSTTPRPLGSIDPV